MSLDESSLQIPKLDTRRLSLAYKSKEIMERLNIKPSANAWWTDLFKVYRLLSAFEIGCTIQEACVNAGITVKQYKYFARLHPEIREVRTMLKAMLMLKARVKLAEAVQNDLKVAMKYLTWTMPEEFKLRRPSSYRRMPIV